jgi:hypothetical protein
MRRHSQDSGHGVRLQKEHLTYRFQRRITKGMTALQRFLLLTVILVAVALAGCNGNVQEHSVTLSWRPSPSTQESLVTGYNVYRRTAQGTSFVRIATNVPTASYKDRVVSSRTTYSYAVTAVDQLGRESAFSTLNNVAIP